MKWSFGCAEFRSVSDERNDDSFLDTHQCNFIHKAEPGTPKHSDKITLTTLLCQMGP